MTNDHGNEIFMTPDDFIRSLTPNLRQPEGKLNFILNCSVTWAMDFLNKNTLEYSNRRALSALQIAYLLMNMLLINLLTPFCSNASCINPYIINTR